MGESANASAGPAGRRCLVWLRLQMRVLSPSNPFGSGGGQEAPIVPVPNSPHASRSATTRAALIPPRRALPQHCIYQRKPRAGRQRATAAPGQTTQRIGSRNRWALRLLHSSDRQGGTAAPMALLALQAALHTDTGLPSSKSRMRRQIRHRQQWQTHHSRCRQGTPKSPCRTLGGGSRNRIQPEPANSAREIRSPAHETTRGAKPACGLQASIQQPPRSADGVWRRVVHSGDRGLQRRSDVH